ncbi:MAG: WD40 repeat domain-containing protein [Promethearchaeota archaeon]
MKSITSKVILILIGAALIVSNIFFLVRNTLLLEDHDNANLLLTTSPIPTTIPLWTYSPGTQSVNEVAISSDGSHISALSYISFSGIDGTLSVLNNTHTTLKRPMWNYSISEVFSSIAISANGSYIAVGGGYDDKGVYLFNNSGSVPIWTNITDGWIYSIAISDDGSYIAAASGSSKVFFFNYASSIPLWEAPTSGLALKVEISSDGNYIAAADNAGNLYFFNKMSSTPLWTFSIIDASITSLSMSDDGSYIVIADENYGRMYLFHRGSSIPIWMYNFNQAIESIKFSPEGNFIVVGCLNGDIFLFNRFFSFPIWTSSIGQPLYLVDISFNGGYIVAQNRGREVYLFNTKQTKPIWKYLLESAPGPQPSTSLDMSLNGKYIVSGCGYNVYLFDRDIIIDGNYIIISESIILIITGILAFISIIVFIKKIQIR